MKKEKIDKLLSYLKNFGIVLTATVGLYGVFKLADSIVKLAPAMEEIKITQEEIREMQTKQGYQINTIESEIVDVKMIQGEQIKSMESIAKKHNELLTIIPQVTKQNIMELLIPVQEELKKNGFTTQSNVNERGAS